MLENNVDEKYFLSDLCVEKLIRNGNNTIYNDKDISNVIISGYYKSGKIGQYIRVKNATKKGYLEAEDGDGIDISQINSKTRRGRVQKEMIQTLDCQGGNNKGVVIKKDTDNYISWEKTGYLDVDCRAFKEDKISGTIVTGAKNKVLLNNLRIRKLTPRECWRLMGFSDDAFDKASKVCSNTQLYKQAGNSIVVNILMGIIKELLKYE